MMEKYAKDYGTLLQSINLEHEVNPICRNLDVILARLGELDILLSNIKGESNSVSVNTGNALNEYKNEITSLCENVDSLEKFVHVVHSNVSAMEVAVKVAEEELNINDRSFKSLILKPLKNKASDASETTTPTRTNLQDSTFQGPTIFKTNDYF